MLVAAVSDELSVAAIGAAVGVILTVAVNAFIGYRGRRSQQLALLDEVWSEVDGLGAAAAMRMQQVRDGLSLFPPLRNEAWKVARASRALERLEPKERSALIGLYDEVEAANYLSRQGQALFAISQIADGDSVVLLEKEANRLTTQPFDDVVDAAVAAKAVRR
jgi:hypothetical protein